jgi:hypothetical protein
MSVAVGFGRQLNHMSGVNNYVPKMTGCARMDLHNGYAMDLGTPVLAVAAGILSAAAVGATYTVADFLATGDLVGGRIVSAPWGRELTFVASGAATNACTVYARDYLGQPVKKTVTLNGTTPVLLGSAIKWLDSIVIPSGGSSTVNVGYGAKLGLEYRTILVDYEMNDDAKVAAGTLVAPVVTDPATITTGDPRGMYTTTTALDGSLRFFIKCSLNPVLNSSNNGGLHGIQHYGG